MSDSTNMPYYIMMSNFNLRIQKQARFHCDVKLSQTCPIRSHKRARFYKETTLSFHPMHVYNSVRVSVLLLHYKTIDISLMIFQSGIFLQNFVSVTTVLK